MMVPPGLSRPLRLGLVDHGDADAVFDRAAGIQVIGFDVDFGFAIAGQAIEANQRRMADGFEDVFAASYLGREPLQQLAPKRARQFSRESRRVYHATASD